MDKAETARPTYQQGLEQISSDREALERGLFPAGRTPQIILTEIEHDSVNKFKIKIPYEIVPTSAIAYVAEIPQNSIGHGRNFVAIKFYKK